MNLSDLMENVRHLNHATIAPAGFIDSAGPMPFTITLPLQIKILIIPSTGLLAFGQLRKIQAWDESGCSSVQQVHEQCSSGESNESNKPCMHCYINFDLLKQISYIQAPPAPVYSYVGNKQ